MKKKGVGAAKAAKAKPQGKARKAGKGKDPAPKKKRNKALEEEIESDDGVSDSDFDEQFGDVLARIAARNKPAPAPKKGKRREEEEEEDLHGLLDAPDDDLVEGGDVEDAEYERTILAAMEAEEAAPEPRRAGPVGAENSFGLTAADEKGSSGALLELLAQETGSAQLKQQLQGLQQPLHQAGSETHNKRAERRLQYEMTTQQAKKWVAQITRNRDASQLDLGQEDPQMARSSVAQLATGFSAETDFERDLASAVEQAGLQEDDLRGELLPGQSQQVLDEKREESIQRLKFLMFREHARAKRVNKIKSKAYRRIHNKSEKLEHAKLMERLERENPELAAELKQGLEKKYAEQRTQRQRTARVRWAKVMQRFGGEDARKAVAQQAQRQADRVKDLERAVKGRPKGESDSDSDVDDALDEAAASESVIAQAKRLVQESAQSQGAELPKKGLFGMKFMRDAQDRKREEADALAKGVLKELDQMGGSGSSDSSSEAGEESASEAAPISAEERLEAERAVDAMLADGMDGPQLATVKTTVAGAVTVKPRAEPNPWGTWDGKDPGVRKDAGKLSGKSLAADASSGLKWGESAKAGAAAAAAEPAKDKGKAKGKRAKGKLAKPSQAAPEAAADGSNAVLDGEDQEQLLEEAFGCGAPEEEYAEAKKETKEVELPGWGCWAGEGMKHQVTAPDALRKKPKRKAGVDPDLAPLKKKPALVVNEQLDRKAAKYFVQDLPFGVETKEAYEAKLQHPTGPEWNSLPVHQRLIQPKIWARVGQVVAPLQYAKKLPAAERDAVLSAWDQRKKPKPARTKF